MKIIKNIKNGLSFVLKDPLNYVFCIAWGSVLLGYWRGINNHIPVLKEFTDELEWAIVLIPLLMCLRRFSRLLRPMDYIFVFVCAFVYLSNFILFPENEKYLSERAFNFIILVLPYFWVGAALDIKKYVTPFFYISVIAIIMCAFYQLSYAQSKSYRGDLDTTKYNMELSYNLLQHVLIVSWIALKEMKPWKITIMLLGIFMLLSFGTRGPVVCMILFVSVYLLFYRPSKYHNTIRIIITSIAVVLLTFMEQFMLFMQGLVLNMGLSTRIFDKYFENDLGYTADRDILVEQLNQVMLAEPQFFGYGVLGSYRYIGTYPHKVWIEFIFSFGWLIGCMLLFALSILIYKAYKRCVNETERIFLILLLDVSVVKLCFSGTFIDDVLFFMLLGYSMQKVSSKLYSGIRHNIHKYEK